MHDKSIPCKEYISCMINQFLESIYFMHDKSFLAKNIYFMHDKSIPCKEYISCMINQFLAKNIFHA
jgi:hypothetical protein